MKKVLLIVLAALFAASPAMAQTQRIEASGFFGYTISDGVTFEGVPVNGVVYNTIEPKDSPSFGFTFGVYVTEQAELEFLWSRQMSSLEISGTGKTVAADMAVDNWHGNIVYNFGYEDSKVRPFVLVGLGATTYGDAEFTGKTTTGDTQFSWAIGGGLKAFPSKNIGFKAMARWTPTYIKTDSTGYWCDPWWGCYPTGDAQYSSQIEFSGGLVVRF